MLVHSTRKRHVRSVGNRRLINSYIAHLEDTEPQTGDRNNIVQFIF